MARSRRLHRATISKRLSKLSFDGLLRRLSGQAGGPVAFIAFDALAVADEDLRDRGLVERRRRLEQLELRTPVVVTIQTDDRGVAESWLRDAWGRGLEGVVAKRAGGSYRGGRRDWLKIKAFESADVVVGGYTGLEGDPRALVLGAYDETGALHCVGTTTWLSDRAREELRRVLPALATSASLTGIRPGQSRWERDRDVVWLPLEPRLVAEVAVGRIDGFQFRHAARFVRWRPDKAPGECTVASVKAVAARAGFRHTSPGRGLHDAIAPARRTRRVTIRLAHRRGSRHASQVCRQEGNHGQVQIRPRSGQRRADRHERALQLETSCMGGIRAVRRVAADAAVDDLTKPQAKAAGKASTKKAPAEAKTSGTPKGRARRAKQTISAGKSTGGESAS